MWFSTYLISSFRFFSSFPQLLSYVVTGFWSLSSWHYSCSTCSLFQAPTANSVFILAASDALYCCMSCLLLFLKWGNSDCPDSWTLLIPAWPLLTNVTADVNISFHTKSLLYPQDMHSNVSMKKCKAQSVQMCFHTTVSNNTKLKQTSNDRTMWVLCSSVTPRLWGIYQHHIWHR